MGIIPVTVRKEVMVSEEGYRLECDLCGMALDVFKYDEVKEWAVIADLSYLRHIIGSDDMGFESMLGNIDILCPTCRKKHEKLMDKINAERISESKQKE